MKKLTLTAFSALALSLTSSSVFAVDGTITVNGVVTDQTCTLQGYNNATGLQDITVKILTVPKSSFSPTDPSSSVQNTFTLQLTNASGTGKCDAATSKALQGIHLSAISATDLDAADKTLLINKSLDASTTNPVFFRIFNYAGVLVDFSAPWGTQARSPVTPDITGYKRFISYTAQYFTKTGVVDAQNAHAIVNYTMHYN
ncbi:type 1 fimbrial protein [Acinetobacter sp. RIT698]|uniref:fimbrial protein n=1 Tax=Acinetobacter TaxID=469 RepID=UPI0012AD01D0|nr:MULTISPECIES: type 1 fimbrial protein [Acinetobacter]MCS4299497.1 major type 1 subunit fimbrin (pilin) [Acinetobacter guillouiae]MCW2252922.1 major type 1 subunit fimbrin (pilin) [Acinetobacter sp. BIGb0204]MRT39681.1 type 1 fimbrial protein [Acinetobacter sp. RIT698]NII36310.1 major type 1 subunit fimbrin (pilin) [Acinetobacter sp. BIGb0196]